MQWPTAFRRQAPPDDARQVLDAAALLQIREFDLFRLAWWRWSGEEPDEKALERPFVAYMFHQAVPPWVRHFCREVLRQEREHRLDPRAFGADRVARREPMVRLGKLYVAITFGLFLIFYVVLLSTDAEPHGPQPLACEAGPGLSLLSDLAHALSGRAPPPCGFE